MNILLVIFLVVWIIYTVVITVQIVLDIIHQRERKTLFHLESMLYRAVREVQRDQKAVMEEITDTLIAIEKKAEGR